MIFTFTKVIFQHDIYTFTQVWFWVLHMFSWMVQVRTEPASPSSTDLHLLLYCVLQPFKVSQRRFTTSPPPSPEHYTPQSPPRSFRDLSVLKSIHKRSPFIPARICVRQIAFEPLGRAAIAAGTRWFVDTSPWRHNNNPGNKNCNGEVGAGRV